MERDFGAIIHPIIDPLVENPSAIMIRQLPTNSKKDISILIVAEDADTARLIGKRGAVANALRDVIGVAGKSDGSNVRIHLKFESFTEGEEEPDGK